MAASSVRVPRLQGAVGSDGGEAAAALGSLVAAAARPAHRGEVAAHVDGRAVGGHRHAQDV